MQSLKSIDLNDNADLNYSVFVSMAKEDLPQVKRNLIKAIEQCRLVIRDSKE